MARSLHFFEVNIDENIKGNRMLANKFEPSPKKDLIARTFHLETALIKPMRQVSEYLGISQSELVRRSIFFYIKEFQENNHMK
jgi:hypothetical protein